MITIQYLRAFAASLVVLRHAISMVVQDQFIWPVGQLGVEIFFVISGFVMWTTTRDDQRTPVDFWKARVLRIVPLYWFFTTLYIVAAAAGLTTFSSPAFDFSFVLKSYFFIPATNPGSGLAQPLYSLGWTLNYEMFFYFLFGLALFIDNKAWRLLAISTLLTLLVWVGPSFDPANPVFKIYTNVLLLDFLAGVLLARLSPVLMKLGAAAGLFLIASGAAMAAAWSAIWSFGPAAILIVGGAVALEQVAQQRPNQIALLLGNASYSIYLAHPFFLHPLAFALRSVGALPDIAVVLMGVLVGMAGGVASYMLIERRVLAGWNRRSMAASLPRVSTGSEQS